MRLQKEIDKLHLQLAETKLLVEKLSQENKELRKRNADLESRLSIKKNSSNSSIPPSQDQNRKKGNKNTSLRKKTGKKTGGQKGHKGTTLEMTSNPDSIEMHIPSQCSCCGELLEAAECLIGKRQVIDVPPIKATTTEHQIYYVECKCGMLNKGQYPKCAKIHVSYGPNVEAMISYLNTRQYMSILRIEEFFHQVVGIKLSLGTIINKLNSYADKCSDAYEER